MNGQEVDEAAARGAGMDPDRLAGLIAFLDRKYIATGRLPHFQIMVSRREQPLLFASRGRARQSGEPLGSDALFRIASMTKPVTSVAFMMLVEAGLVALDDPVARVIPEFSRLTVGLERAPLKRPMLMIDLLRHTSGLTYGLQRQTAIDALYRERGLDEFQQPRSSDEYIAALADIPLEFSPGDQWNYSVSTDVLGVVVERLSGLSLGTCLRERIFDPLHMPDTMFEVTDDRVDRLTDAWQLEQDRSLSLADRGARSGWRRSGRFASGGGGLVSSTADYHRFCRMLLRDGELDGARLLRPETMAMMRRNQLPGGADLASLSTSLFSEATYAGTGFGLGFAVTTDPSQSIVPGSAGEYYWGGIFSTAFYIDPVEALIILFMTQHLPSATLAVRAELRQQVQAAVLQRNGDRNGVKGSIF
ncbi:serine hydrolase domain-containing protein [Sphingobium sp. AN641]|uniref:serine hydrolase domain-containing protein n=1 Tax=Sphingobium sp. AN641 TaxID=3133443 RepID=UPI0030BA8072